MYCSEDQITGDAVAAKMVASLTWTIIELINADDLALARRHIIDEDEIKRIHLNMLADSGAFMMPINENIQAVLQLPFIEKEGLF